jgi:hypothetical protein
MLDTLQQWTDRLLGRGSAAITVPVMDGALLPNRVLDQATVLAELPGIDDLAFVGPQLMASAGSSVWQWNGTEWACAHRFDDEVTALAVSPRGRMAVALGGREVRVLGRSGQPDVSLGLLGSAPLVGTNALAWQGEDGLFMSDGSTRHGTAQWSRDLMTLGRSGRVGRWTVGAPHVDVLGEGFEYAFGVLPWANNQSLVSESWRHRVLLLGDGKRLSWVAELPSYPSRMAPASDGGVWLTCFVSRTQLVEFVLREPAYRQRMVDDIAPEHWIVPALSSGHSFQEPLQGAGVKNMGVLKPWAPRRSYGLVLHVSADGRILRSLHSQVDGKHHGITAVVEHGGALYLASKGSGRLLKVDNPMGQGAQA